MLAFVWIVRLACLVCLLPVLLPVASLASALAFSPIVIALLALALALLALAIVFGLLLGVLGPVADALILFGLIGLAWKWPRGIRAGLTEKLRLAYRGLRNAISRQLRDCTLVDFAFCLVIALLAVVLSLSSGLLHFLLTALVVLFVVGVVWKWPQAPRFPLMKKLRLAIRELLNELRRMFH